MSNKNETNQLKSDDATAKKLNEIHQVLMSMMALDFTKAVSISNNNDILDGIATGINILGEELLATTVSKNYFNNIFESIKDIIIVINSDYTIKSVNKATLDILGYTENELIGFNIFKIIN